MIFLIICAPVYQIGKLTSLIEQINLFLKMKSDVAKYPGSIQSGFIAYLFYADR